MATWVVELTTWQLGLPEILAVPWGHRGRPNVPNLHPHAKKNTERNSQWHHQTHLFTEKRFQAANRSWAKRQLQAVVTRTVFFLKVDSFKPLTAAAVRLDNAIPNCFC
jgi:hypothetical protein